MTTFHAEREAAFSQSGTVVIENDEHYMKKTIESFISVMVLIIFTIQYIQCYFLQKSHGRNCLCMMEAATSSNRIDKIGQSTNSKESSGVR